MIDKAIISKMANGIGLIIRDAQMHKSTDFYQGELEGVRTLLNAIGCQLLNTQKGFIIKSKASDEMYKFNFTNNLGRVELLESKKHTSRRALKEELYAQRGGSVKDTLLGANLTDKKGLIKKGEDVIRGIKPENFKSDVEWLWKNKCGCVYYKLFNTENFEYDLCIGWSDGFDENDGEGIYLDGTYAIVARFGRQSFDNAMQTDLDWDFEMPWKEGTESGDLFDNTEYISRNENYARLLKYFEGDVKNLVNFVL